jgi:small-conductance mechanosensitive channel
MRNSRRRLAASLLFAMAALFPAAAQTPATNAPATNSPATNAPAAAAPTVPLSDVVTQSVTDFTTLQEMQQHFSADVTEATVKETLPILTSEIDRRLADDGALLGNNPSLPQLRNAQASWQMLSDSLDDSRQTLSNRIATLDNRITALGQMQAKWEATQKQSAGAPGEVLGRISAVLNAITQTTRTASDLRARLLLLQNTVEDQDTRIATEITDIKARQQNAVGELFQRDSPPLWEIGRASATPVSPENSFDAELTSLRAFAAEKYPTFYLHLALFLFLAVGIFAVRGEVRKQVAGDPDMRQAAAVFEVPLATALVLALLASSWLYPLPPSLFTATLGAIAIVPTVVVLRRLLDPNLIPILYALVAAYFVDHLRLIFPGSSWTGRLIFTGEMLTGLGFLIWLRQSKKLRGAGPNPFFRGFLRVYSVGAAILFSAAVLANLLGYLRLSTFLGTGLLNSSYLLVALVAAVRIVEGLVLGALRLPPMSMLGMIRNHYPTLRRRLGIGLRVISYSFWAWRTLDFFFPRTPFWGRLWMIFNASVPSDSSLSLGRFILVGLLIWGAFLLSRFIRFVLQEEIYPKFQLAPGLPYAISTIIHYVVVVFGVIWALHFIGIDLSSPQFTVLGGALGVGLGFGLQNILNNFVSGIILLFERPIKVGDIIQVDTNVGTVEKIGIRASVLRLTNGSEYILPNGNLISNPVTNWTFSNRRRVIDLPVVVAAKADPQQVMSILVATARANPLVLKNPPPHALLTTLSGASLSFEVRVWTDSSENWLQVRSDLALAISAALARENIAMS